MIRFLNVVVISALVAAAIAVYSIKYEATRQAEKVTKLQRAIGDETDAISRLQAEWAELIQPNRLAGLSQRHLDLQPMRITQVVTAAEIPDKPTAADLIAQKLAGLGIARPDPVSAASKPAASVTASAARPASQTDPIAQKLKAISAAPAVKAPPRGDLIAQKLKGLGLGAAPETTGSVR